MGSGVEDGPEVVKHGEVLLRTESQQPESRRSVSGGTGGVRHDEERCMSGKVRDRTEGKGEIGV